MAEMIELDESVVHPLLRVPGWEVAVSRAVWERCVAVPDGVEGQSETLRLWDLLVFLWAAFRDYLASGRDSFAGFVFRASVVNDNRDWAEDAGELDWPDPNVRLVAVACINTAGRPCLLVMPTDTRPGG